MKRLALPLLFLTVLAACAPLRLYYKQGAPEARWQADTTTCQVSALRDAPVANQTYRDPPRYVPPRRYCDSAGNCTTYHGYWLPGDVYTVDVNAKLRGRLETQCMAAKGYSPVEVPRCPQGAVVVGGGGVLPPLTDRSCAIENPDGSLRIVTRQ